MEDIQIQVYKLINKAINNNYASLTDSIIRRRCYLDRMDIIHDAYLYFCERNYVSKFNPNKGKLSNFVYQFCRWFLSTACRKKYNPELLFSDLTRINDQGEIQEFQVPDFNTPESLLLEKNKTKNSLKEFILNKREE